MVCVDLYVRSDPGKRCELVTDGFGELRSFNWGAAIRKTGGFYLLDFLFPVCNNAFFK